MIDFRTPAHPMIKQFDASAKFVAAGKGIARRETDPSLLHSVYKTFVKPENYASCTSHVQNWRDLCALWYL